MKKLLLILLSLVLNQLNASKVFVFEDIVFKPIDGEVNIERSKQIKDLKDYIENDIRIYNKIFVPDLKNEITEIFDIALFEEHREYKVYVVLNKNTKERIFVANSITEEKYFPEYIYYDQFIKSSDLSLFIFNYKKKKYIIEGKIKDIDVLNNNEYIYEILSNKKEFIHKGYFEHEFDSNKERKRFDFKTGLFIENNNYVLKAYDIKENDGEFFSFNGFDRSDCYFGHSGHKEHERFYADILTTDLYHPYIYHDKKEGINLDNLRKLYKKSKSKIPVFIKVNLRKAYKNHYRYINTAIDNYTPYPKEEIFDKEGFNKEDFDQFRYNIIPLELNYENDEMKNFLEDFITIVYNNYHYLEPFININEIDYQILYVDLKNKDNKGLKVSLLLKDKENKEFYLREIIGKSNIKFDGFNFMINDNNYPIFYKKYDLREFDYKKEFNKYFNFVDKNFNINYFPDLNIPINTYKEHKKIKEKRILIRALQNKH